MLREIACKTLVGRGRINYFLEKNIKLDCNVSKTLGCWIINLNYEIIEEKKELYLNGFYSIQLWYALDEDKSSSVYEEKISFKEKVNMVYRHINTLNDKKDVKVFVNKYPNAVYMQLGENNNINLKIEALYFIDVYQEAILIIDTKENVKPEMTLDEELLLNVNPNYLVDNEKNKK